MLGDAPLVADLPADRRRGQRRHLVRVRAGVRVRGVRVRVKVS